MKKPIILLVSLLVLGSAVYLYKMYNKPHTNVADTEAAETLSAADFFEVFDTSEAAAMIKYADKVIEVEGVLYAKDLSNDLEPQVVLEGNGDNGFVRCGFKPEELDKVNDLAEHSVIKVKGLCKGINSAEGLDLLADIDVVLSSCIIIE